MAEIKIGIISQMRTRNGRKKNVKKFNNGKDNVKSGLIACEVGEDAIKGCHGL
jgi:hypothetical protein